jgi:lysophospholipase L1-like esterase
MKRYAVVVSFAVRNRGFGGSTMTAVLAHTNHFMRYRCTRVVVYEGENDLRRTNSTPAMLLARCQTFVTAMNSGDIRRDIYFVSIKTCPARWHMFATQSAANELLRAYAARTPRVHFIDIVPVLLNDDFQPDPALYVADNVHFNAQGYARIAPVIKRALGAPE